MKSGTVGKIVSWIASAAGSLCLAALGLGAVMFVGLVKDPTDQALGWSLLPVTMAFGVLGSVSLVAGLLGLFLTDRSSRASWFGVVMGLVTAAILGGIFGYLSWVNS